LAPLDNADLLQNSAFEKRRIRRDHVPVRKVQGLHRYPASGRDQIYPLHQHPDCIFQAIQL